jgi:hypothetical protein
MSDKLSNTERLRAHLAEDGLAAALLAAWASGNRAQLQARMLVALNEFHAPKQAKSDGTETQ